MSETDEGPSDSRDRMSAESSVSADSDAGVTRIFEELFPAARDLTDDSARPDVDGWDSLGHLELVSALEAEFSVFITPELALDIETVGGAKRLITRLVVDE